MEGDNPSGKPPVTPIPAISMPHLRGGMTKKFADIVRCLRCERIKAWDEDCSYLGCNPELHWQEATAVEVYSALHPEGVERERLRGENAALREGHQWILRAANDVQEGKTSEAMALIAIEDFANYSLTTVPADARGEDAPPAKRE